MYSETRQDAESMRYNVLFGINDRHKLEAENEALRIKADHLQNTIDKLLSIK